MSNEHVHPIFRTILESVAPPIRDEFDCKVCGVKCPIAPADGSGAICEAHCPDHIYLYMGADGHRCRVCFAPQPPDWYE